METIGLRLSFLTSMSETNFIFSICPSQIKYTASSKMPTMQGKYFPKNPYTFFDFCDVPSFSILLPSLSISPYESIATPSICNTPNNIVIPSSNPRSTIDVTVVMPHPSKNVSAPRLISDLDSVQLTPQIIKNAQTIIGLITSLTGCRQYHTANSAAPDHISVPKSVPTNGATTANEYIK